MQDIINSFKAHLYDRTSNPLVGSFIFYWLICNYKLVIVLLDGDLKANEKFDLIDTLYPTFIESGLTGFLLPLVLTLAYIYIVPYPAKKIYEFWKSNQKEIQEIKQKIDDETPLTKEQSRKIRQDMINLEMEYENLLKQKNEDNRKFKEANKQIEKLVKNGTIKVDKEKLNT